MVSVLNRAVASFMDGLLWPFRSWPALAGLTVVSLMAALIILAVFKATVDERSVMAVKRQIHAGLFELRLFRDDPRTVLLVAGELFRRQLSYLRYMLVPLLWIAAPLAFLIAHLQAHYGYQGLRPGEMALVKVRVAASQSLPQPTRPAVALEAPNGLRVDTLAVWAPALHEMAWRLSASRDGDYDLRVSSGRTVVTKQVRVSSLIVRRATIRPAPTFWAQLRSPAEGPLPADAGIDAIEITYPERDIDILGLRMHWLVVFLLLSTAFTFLCRSAFGVVI